MQVAEDLQIDPDRFYVAGLSAGGAMAALMGDLFPDLYAAVGVHSGLAPLAATDLSSGLAAMRGVERVAQVPTGMPTIVFHGDRDIVVHPINGLQVMEASFGAEGLNQTRNRVGHQGRGFTCRDMSMSKKSFMENIGRCTMADMRGQVATQQALMQIPSDPRRVKSRGFASLLKFLGWPRAWMKLAMASLAPAASLNIKPGSGRPSASVRGTCASASRASEAPKTRIGLQCQYCARRNSSV